jgi:hypothetical protein
MKVLLDTDILLDVALRRAEFFEGSAAVLRWAESEPGHAAVAWHSLSNISYLLRPDARPFLRDLLEFAVVPTTGTDTAQRALGFQMKDFEDSLQAAAALSFGAVYIVTRNTAHYRKSPVPAISPHQFIRQVTPT